MEKFDLKKTQQLVDKSPQKDGFKELCDCLEEGERKMLEKVFDLIFREGYGQAREFYKKQIEEMEKRQSFPSPPPSAKPQVRASGNQIRESVGKVIQRIKDGKITLPVFPHVAKKVLKMLDDQGITVQKMARELQFDQAISSKMISISNSAFYGGIAPTKNLETAIIKVGLLEVRKHLYSIATKDIYKLENPLFGSMCQRLAYHATASASSASSAARYLGYADHERYLLFALFHDIGKLWLLQILSDVVSLEKTTDKDVAIQSVSELFGVLHAKMGASLLTRWDFDPEFAQIALHHHDSSDSSNKALSLTQFGNYFSKSLGYSVIEGEEFQEQLDQIRGILKIDDELIGKLSEDLLQFMKLQLQN